MRLRHSAAKAAKIHHRELALNRLVAETLAIKTTGVFHVDARRFFFLFLVKLRCESILNFHDRSPFATLAVLRNLFRFATYVTPRKYSHRSLIFLLFIFRFVVYRVVRLIAARKMAESIFQM